MCYKAHAVPRQQATGNAVRSQIGNDRLHDDSKFRTFRTQEVTGDSAENADG